MSCGGVFKLVANDGKADRMILATLLLNQRINDIMIARRLAGKADFTPTLPDLERTHILYMNAHFKPYAAIGFEYNKIKPQSGTPTLGTQMTFSIPQFGDFFYDMVCHIVIPSINGSLVNFPSTPPTLWDPNTIVNGAAPTNAYNPFLPAGAPTVLTGSFIVKNMTSPYAGVLFTGGTYSSSQNTYTPTDIAGKTDKGAVSGVCVCGILQYSFVDCFGNAFPTDSTTGLPNPATPVSNFVRYCEYPGNFIVVGAKFDVNGNPLDSYDQYVSIMQEKFWITPNKRVGYNRLVGQQNPIQGQGSLISASVVDVEYLTPSSNTSGGSITPSDTKQNPGAPALFATVAGMPSVTPSGFSSNTALNTQSISSLLNPQSASQGQTDYSQNMLFFTNGPQTPKQTQPPLDLWIKLNFWFNNNVSLAVPSVSIPFGQRFITINLAAAQGSSQGGNLIYEYPAAFLRTTFSYNADAPWVPCFASYVNPDGDLVNGTNLNTTVINYYAWSAENSYLTSNLPGVSPSSNGTTYSRDATNPFPVSNNFPGITFPTTVPQLVSINNNVFTELYINNIFVNPEIHDIYIKRIGFSLIRVFREQIQPVGSGALSDILLSQLKWPIEYMFVALQPTWNTNTTYNTNAWRDWHRMTKQINSLPSSTLLENHYAQGIFPNVTPGTAVNTSDVTITQEAVSGVEYWLPVPTIDTMSITSHGIQLFDHLPSPFYNTYMPYNFGTPMMNTPDDIGVMFVTFALYPGNYQPSGHLNISRARETYVNISSTYVAQTNGKVLFIAVAIAINFLLISDGSAVLRYST